MFMNLLAWLIWLIIGAIIGLIAGASSENPRRRNYEVLIGILGAFLAAFIFNRFGFVGITDFHPGNLLVAPIGAILLIALYRYLARRYLTRIDYSRGVYTSELVEKVEEKRQEEKIVRRPVYFHRGFILMSILLLPLLDLLLLRLSIPDISQANAPFGIVESYQSEEGQLNYLVYRPETAAADAEIPLVLALHGCTQDPFMLEASSGLKNLADTQGFMLIYPQQNANASPHRCWNWYEPRNQARETGEPSMLAGIVRQVSESYAVDDSRIYVTGLSSGGAMTSILASCFPDLFAAAAVHSGMAYKSANSAAQALIAPFSGNQTPPNIAGEEAYRCSGTQNQTIPMLMLHGTADTVVFPINGRHTLEEFAQLNDFEDDGEDNDSVQAVPTNTQTQQVEGGHSYIVEDYNYNGELLMQAYIVDGLQHMWSGGTGIYPLSDPKAPNATQIFWDFMSQYQLNNTQAETESE
jgi:poly(hydroxyalkanoate) depolymerase family esterase